MDAESEPPVHNMFHHEIKWTIANVYMCSALLDSWLEGPDFKTDNPLFPWMLKLGQTTYPRFRGIALYLQRVSPPTDVVVNVRVTVTGRLLGRNRNVGSDSPVLKEVTFDKENDCRQCLILCSNGDFKRNALTDYGPSQNWKIKVELVWQEIAKPTNPEEYSTDGIVDARIKRVGIDLKTFFHAHKFSDLYLKIAGEDFPAHRAILAARSPRLSAIIDAYNTNRKGKGVQVKGIFPTTDLDLNKVILNYIYSGDVEEIMQNGPLPIALHPFAQLLDMYHLKNFTCSYLFEGISSVWVESVKSEWVLRPDEIFQQSGNISPHLFGNPAKETFLLDLKYTPAENDSPASISPCFTYCYCHPNKRRSIYIVVDISVKSDEGNVIASKKLSATLRPIHPTDSIEFDKLVILDEQFTLQNPNLERFHFTCIARYWRHTIKTVVESMPFKYRSESETPQENPLKKYRGGDRKFGFINMANDLRQLLLSEKHSNCTIIVGETKLPAHKVILAARSSYFSDLFDRLEDIQERAPSPHLPYYKRIFVEETSPPMDIFIEKDIKIDKDLMKIILEEIYCGNATIPNEMIRQVSPLAKFFGLRELEKWCLENTESNRTEGNSAEEAN